MKNTLIGIIFLVVLWSLISFSKIVSPLLLPQPQRVFSTLFKLLFSGDLNNDIKFTIYRWIIGYIMGVAIGVPIGLLMGSSKIFYQLFEFPVDFFRSLPVTALFPLFLLAFGIGNSSKIAMVFAAVVFVVIITTAYGVIQASRSRFLMAKVFGASKIQIFKDIILWDSLPHIMVGMRITLSTSLIVVIISEMFIGTQFGLGQRLFDSYSKNVVSELYSVLLFVGVFGYLLNKLFVFFEKRVVFWVGK